MLPFAQSVFFFLTAFSVCAAGNVTPGSDGCLEAEVKWITLSCQAQEVIGAKTDHFPGTGPTPRPRVGGRTFHDTSAKFSQPVDLP